MTAPNEITPAGFLSATGLAAFAAKTREDWETEQRNAMVSAFTDANTGFAQIRTWIDRLIALLPTEARTILKSLLDGLAGITNFDAWVSVLKAVINTFKTLFDSLGSKVWTVLSEIVTHFSGLFTNAGDVIAWLTAIPANLLSVIEAITGGAVATLQEGITKLTEFTQSLPNLGSLISGLMGSKVNPATGTNTTLPDLIWWGSQLLLSTSIIPSFNLFGTIPADLLALIGVGNIGDVTPNLVTDSGFSATTTLQAGFGWTWDGTTNSTGSTGGSARVACDGGVKYLFSNLIPVATGQQITVSAKAKYTKGSAATATIVCGVRTYNGDTLVTTQLVQSASAAAGTTTSVGLTGADAAGFRLITGTYEVPANITQVRLVLGVTVGTTGTVVWFDQASLTKTSKLDQGLVKDLTGSLTNLLPKGTFEGLLNTVTGLTGATVDQVKDVIDGKYTPGDTISGTWIKAGDISSAFITELQKTWTEGKQAIDGGDIPATGTYGDLATALKGWGANIVALQTLTSAAVGSINTAVSTANSLKTRTTSLETKMAAVEAKLSIPVVPPVTPPIIVSAYDDFERASLGSNWTVSYSISDGSVLGITTADPKFGIQGGDAKFSIPGGGVNTQSKVAAIWAGTGNTSSEYQKIYTTLGTKAGIPAAGTQGFNDLIGRAKLATTCLICRFFPDGRVQFLYRYGSWTEVPIGTTQTFATGPTTGTGLEFYCGDKMGLVSPTQDQTKLIAKIGTSTKSVNVPADILAAMGKGWGFGMGNGLSALIFGVGQAQGSGTINYWGGQDQP
jgi:hypothetical protein